MSLDYSILPYITRTIYYHILPIFWIYGMFHFAPSFWVIPSITRQRLLRLWDLDAGEVMKELMDLWYPLVSSHPDPPKIFQNNKLCEVDSSIVC